MKRVCWSVVSVLAVVCTVGACARPGRAPRNAGAERRGRPEVESRFRRIAETYYRDHFAFRPQRAVRLGHHDFDGRLPDYSRDAVAREVRRLGRARKQLEAIDPRDLSLRTAVEREVLLTAIRREVFQLEVLAAPFHNPLFYAAALDLVPYVARDYQPVARRAEAVIAIARGATAYLATARANLPRTIPRPWLEVALLQVKGAIAFAQRDIPAAMAALDQQAKTRLWRALEQLVAALEDHRGFLERRQRSVGGRYALGRRRLQQMLRETEGVVIELPRLERLGREDLARNWRALTQAARAIDGSRSVKEVVDEVNAYRISIDEALSLAEKQSDRIRQLILDRAIVSIPGSDRPLVRRTPPFLRRDSAFVDLPGPFESKALPSLFYLSPPDPDWPVERQREYLPAPGDLLFVTVHELWPGHFLDHLHTGRLRSPILKSFPSVLRTEGWAHYAEELMWVQGLGDGDPRARIGQLLNALLGDVRLIAAIGLHAGGMTVEEVEAMFREQALADAATARQQAMRGTFDPMYLGDTLGKLMIHRLHHDWRARMGERYDQRRFHDAFLGWGKAPVPVIRRAMLGAGAGPPL